MQQDRTHPAPDPDDRTLVPAPEVLSTPARRALGIGISLLFVGGLAGAGLLDTFFPVPVPKPQGPDLAQDIRTRANAEVRNGTKMSVWSRDIDSRSNVKRAMVPWYIATLVRELGEADDGHIVGKDHWLFTENRLQSLGIPNDLRQAELGARILRGVERRCAQLGTELLLLPVPRKGYVAAEFLPDGVDAFPDFERTILKRLRAWGVPHVDMLKLFEGRPAEELWYAHDTHWRPKALGLVAKQVAQQLEIGLRPGKRAAIETAGRPRRPKQGILATMGIPLKHPAAFTIPSVPGPTLQLSTRNFRQLGLPRLWRIPPADTAPVWAITGSSFTRGDMLVPLLTNNLGSVPFNGAAKGALGLNSLGEGLRKLIDDLPPYWLAEIPTYQLFTRLTGKDHLKVGPDVIQFFSLTDTGEGQVLRELDHKGRLPLRIKLGNLIHEGDGSVALELEETRPRTKPGAINIYQSPAAYPAPWKPRENKIRIPLLGPKRSWASLIAATSPRTKMGPVRARIVCDYDLEGAVATELQSASEPGADGVWSWVFEFDSPQPIGRHEAIWVEVAGQPMSNWNLRLLAPPGQRDRSLGNMLVRGAATALLCAAPSGGPGHLKGPRKRYTAVVIRGTGAPPQENTSVRLVSLLRR